MARADLLPVLAAALKRGYAVGAFNAIGLSSAEAIVRGAEDARAPVVLALSENAARYTSLSALVALACALADEASVPVVVHFDHGTSVESCMSALNLGCGSAMFDGSALALKENVRLTRLAVLAAHKLGAACEGEIGIVGGKLGQAETSALTKPDQAAAFVASTAVDALACALGTRHGMVTKAGELDLCRAEAIFLAARVPLVLHGSSGVPDAMLRRVGSVGIAKVNVATDLNVVFTSTLRASLEDSPKAVDPRCYVAPAGERMRARVAELCALLGAAGHANTR